MDAQTFLDNFGTIADAPGGVEQLRGLIRDLAVRGQLVPQQSSDDVGGELAEQIRRTRRKLAEVGGVRLPMYATHIRPDEVPFEIPNSWAWCRFGEIHQKLGAGSTPKGGQKVYTSEGVLFLRSQNVHNDGLLLDGVARIPASVHKTMSATVVRPGDVLLNITGASIARAAVVPDDFDEANVSQHVAIVRPVLRETNQWVHLFLVSRHGYRAIMGAQVGISREGLSMTRLRDFVVPLPPLAEQVRIVAKVDELMQLCDDLEARQQAHRDVATRLRASSLDALTSADTDADLHTAWSRIHTNWEALTDHPDSVAVLRQTVLHLAVRGMLVKPRQSDRPALDLRVRHRLTRVD